MSARMGSVAFESLTWYAKYAPEATRVDTKATPTDRKYIAEGTSWSPFVLYDLEERVRRCWLMP